jgi:L-lactate dehydrogenase complex protein LldE
MRVALFIPCYLDQLFPQVGLAALEVLERHDVAAEFPEDQTCCGQPIANAGCSDDARPLARHMLEVFRDHSHVVCPSGSCVAMVRHHYAGLLDPSEHRQLADRTFELCEFLTDVLGVERIGGRFPHRVGLHHACHGLRELRLAGASELVASSEDKVARLLRSIDGLELAELRRPDECCGFGGSFAVDEEAVSCSMGLDRVRDHRQGGAEVITSVDMSCLAQLEGLIRRSREPMRVMHVAEILAGRELAPR